MLHDTIVAISTALSEGAISIVRMSGDRAIEIADELFDRDLLKAKANTITYGNIIDNNEVVDEVLISIFRAPKSYTCEDLVEINCHGGVYVTRTILSLCLSKGARMARPGEFTERAFLNGRIDLTQAEGVQSLVEARDNRHARSAISGLKGSVTKLIEPLREELIQIIANIEVNIDYPEYQDVEVLSQETILPLTKQWVNKMEELVRKAQNSYQVLKGIDTVILGKPNVGKSSLLNALLEEDKAIVTDIAGTTRDLVEGTVVLENITLNLIDTAGIRDTSDKVEKIGIERSLAALDKAELVIVVLDANAELDQEDQELLDKTKDMNRIVVYNKDDDNVFDKGIRISALHGDVSELVEAINERYKEAIADSNESSLNSERQIALAKAALASMKNAVSLLEQGVELDLVTLDLQEAYNALTDILGQSSRDDLLDNMFSRFCLGK